MCYNIIVSIPQTDWSKEMPHTVLIVRIENDSVQMTDSERARRIEHAVPTLGIVKAWFDYGPVGNDPSVPMRFPDGTYKVHAPSWQTLPHLKDNLLPHEGLVVIKEEIEDDDGIHPLDFLEFIAGTE